MGGRLARRSQGLVPLIDERMILDEPAILRAAPRGRTARQDVGLAGRVVRRRRPAGRPVRFRYDGTRKGELLSHIAQWLIRILKNRDEASQWKLRRFLSHAKADGTEAPSKFLDYIIRQPGLSYVYDSNELRPGHHISALSELIEDSAFIAFVGEHYHSCPWCQQEFLLAKRRRVPMVVVEVNSRLVTCRPFPDMGNVPTLRWSDDDSFLPELVGTVTFEMLKQCHWGHMLDDLIVLAPGLAAAHLPRQPELLDLPDFDVSAGCPRRSSRLGPGEAAVEPPRPRRSIPQRQRGRIDGPGGRLAGCAGSPWASRPRNATSTAADSRICTSRTRGSGPRDCCS